MKITKEQYLDALNVVKAYRKQLQKELDEVNKVLSIDSVTDLDDDVTYSLNEKLEHITPARLLNIIAVHCGDKNIKYRERKSHLTVKDILDLDLREVKKWRGLGEKSFLQLKTIIHRAEKP